MKTKGIKIRNVARDKGQIMPLGRRGDEGIHGRIAPIMLYCS